MVLTLSELEKVVNSWWQKSSCVTCAVLVVSSLCLLLRVNPTLGELRPQVGIQCVTVTENVVFMLFFFLFCFFFFTGSLTLFFMFFFLMGVGFYKEG